MYDTLCRGKITSFELVNTRLLHSISKLCSVRAMLFNMSNICIVTLSDLTKVFGQTGFYLPRFFLLSYCNLCKGNKLHLKHAYIVQQKFYPLNKSAFFFLINQLKTYLEMCFLPIN